MPAPRMIDDLRESPSKTKAIRQTCDAVLQPKAQLSVTLAKDELSCKGLTIWHICVVLNLRPANWIELALDNALEERGM